ncbi:Cytochrome C oxidase, cbb3-type, subunit III [Catalinimonas alkaloidigena]|uniref:Cytochrome C oxidase, cbb3-type, subunit III n=1 Tax=Catalinimonas alkaloidigena TaxID=1075417 RepID=A0A1G9J8J3_9BACT|nr:cytochrome c [Catalinimonas alkaloidigena]SDL33859.1 Cytochrome C oxidase, cbb3-type, subunit III [Catalinimonas alkaloidigena]
MTRAFATIALSVILLSGCRYDNEEDLFPAPVAPDSTEISFAQTIQPLLTAHCTGCHGTDTPSAGISLVGHSNVKKWADTGQLLGAIAHQTGFSPMPKGGSKLPAADIERVRRWIEQGTPNN